MILHASVLSCLFQMEYARHSVCGCLSVELSVVRVFFVVNSDCSARGHSGDRVTGRGVCMCAYQLYVKVTIEIKETPEGYKVY